MAYTLLLDTDIIIDFVEQRKYELDAIDEIIDPAGLEKMELFISERMASTCFYVLQKQKMDAPGVLREMGKTTNLVGFSRDMVYYPVEKYKDTEEGILYFIASKAKVDYFITRNGKDFAFLFASHPVMSPTRFLNQTYLNDLPQ